MKLMRLHDKDTGTPLRINPQQVVAITEEDGGAVIFTTEGRGAHCQESREEAATEWQRCQYDA